MDNYYIGFLKDDNGCLSLMRLLSFITWFLFAFVVIWQTVYTSYNEFIVLSLGTLAFMPKVFQKIVERKTNLNNDNKI